MLSLYPKLLSFTFVYAKRKKWKLHVQIQWLSILNLVKNLSIKNKRSHYNHFLFFNPWAWLYCTWLIKQINYSALSLSLKVNLTFLLLSNMIPLIIYSISIIPSPIILAFTLAIMNFYLICEVYLLKIKRFPLIVSTTCYDIFFKSNDLEVVPFSNSEEFPTTLSKWIILNIF